jgi:hypothetical protein
MVRSGEYNLEIQVTQIYLYNKILESENYLNRAEHFRILAAWKFLDQSVRTEIEIWYKHVC